MHINGTNPVSNEEKPAELIKRLNFPFEDVYLITRALTHRSYVNEHPDAIEDNERLEFLGDAILNFTAAAWLYKHFPEMPEGDMTRMRSALVFTDQLADYAVALNLGPAMRLGRGMEVSGGRYQPALLCNTFEALIGALYLQAGISYIEMFMDNFFIRYSEIAIAEHRHEDPKSKLQEWSQGNGSGTPKYLVKSITGPVHARLFQVEVVIGEKLYGQGCGSSKQAAEKNAATAALSGLKLISL
jgi:ribonuclease-3